MTICKKTRRTKYKAEDPPRRHFFATDTNIWYTSPVMDTKMLKKFEKNSIKSNVPNISIGDTVTVTYKIREKDKERLQSFTGIVIASGNHGLAKVITVRKVSSGVGAEKIFPIHSPFINSIEIVKRGKIRRSKLYYMRKRVGKQALKIKERKTKERGKKTKKPEQA